MPKLRIVYILSLVLLGILIVFTMFRPIAKAAEYSEVAKMKLLARDNEYIVEFAIMNHEGEDKEYTINALIHGEIDSRNVLIPDGNVSTYIYHVYPDRINDKQVTFTVSKEGESVPFEEITYYLSETGFSAYDDKQRVQEKK